MFFWLEDQVKINSRIEFITEHTREKWWIYVVMNAVLNTTNLSILTRNICTYNMIYNWNDFIYYNKYYEAQRLKRRK